MSIKLRSVLEQANPSLKISHNMQMLAMGSCFADRIGEQLRQNKFEIKINPLGIAYNPISIKRQLMWMLGREELSDIRYQEDRERWHSFDLHTRMSGASKSQLENRLENLRKELRVYLAQLDLLILTWGTARVYRRVDTGEIVANNYAYPASFFNRELLSLEHMQEASSQVIAALQALNPNLQVLLTVSPVRHVRDGLEANSISKSLLRTACSKLSEQDAAVHYFPAFEIMMDDLRDYRFYEADLIHPNQVAERYIWETFTQRHCDSAMQELLKRIQGINRDLLHKPFNPNTKAYRHFLTSLLQKIDRLAPQISFEKERIDLLKKLEQSS